MKRYCKILIRICQFFMIFLILLYSQFLAVNAAVYSVTTIDPKLKGSLTIEKQHTDENGNTVLMAGIQYQITYICRLDKSLVKETDKDYFQKTIATDKSGEVVFKNLELGRYLIEEKEGRPQGYEQSDSFVIDMPMTNQSKVEYDGVIYEAGEVWEYDLVAELKSELIYGEVELQKVDSKDKSKLVGAEFGLFNRNGEAYVKSDGEAVILVTDKDGKIQVKNLPYGSYYFKELKAPDGYELSDEKFEFNIERTYKEGDENTLVKLTAENTKAQNETEPPTEPPTETPTEPHTKSSEPPTKPTEPTVPKKPVEYKKTIATPAATADESQIILWGGLMAEMLLVIAYMIKSKK